MTSDRPRKRVLFVAEAATLAHVARPTVLARSLDPARFDVCVATGPDFRSLVTDAGLPVLPLLCIGTRAYLAAVAAGRPVYPLDTLQAYVRDDLRLITEFRPDVVVGDFRLSLAVSARLARVPLIAISNAYWSPLAPPVFDVPVHAATRLLGHRIAHAGFQLLRPLIMAQHSLPMHRLRRMHGMASLGFDLRRVFTEADLTLYADIPELVPPAGTADRSRYRYIGAVVWSPDAALPASLATAPTAQPLVYISLGSSGDPSSLDTIVACAVQLGCRVAVVGPSGRWNDRFGDAVVSAPMLPGSTLSAAATMVVCNGGSPGTHQALEQGTPVLGIPSNLDQLLNMHHVVHSGAGLAIRADQVSASRVMDAMRRLLAEAAFTQQAQRLQQAFAGQNAGQNFQAAVTELAR
jgi:UDP:flavonoid glycosyltransferase YjiC (YdhE family)